MKAILDAICLTDQAESYLLGRGASPESIEEFGLGEWVGTDTTFSDPTFVERYGETGDRLIGSLVCPIRTVRNEIIGFESRSMSRKYVARFLTFPKAHWNSVWLAPPSSSLRLWQGGDVWIVEGLFDLFPLQWVVPSGDTVMAALRANLTKKQVEFIRRFNPPMVHMVFDRDETGRKGNKTVLRMLEKAGIRCREVSYSGGKDPGEVWDRGGVEGLKQAFPYGG